ncbi:acyl-CoA dehydrogenase [Mycobacteroides abscessus subsp. abscessus]|nr:acyl-CoA dehydrogenase [Mycobacteroides abscessus subsp. abscessus]
MVVTLLLDVLAAKGFEKNTYFDQVQRLIRTLPRLEGTVHVNVGQILKFLPNYLFHPAEYPEIGTRQDAGDDASWSRPSRCASCSPPRARTRTSRATWISCSPSAICSRWWSTVS